MQLRTKRIVGYGILAVGLVFLAAILLPVLGRAGLKTTHVPWDIGAPKTASEGAPPGMMNLMSGGEMAEEADGMEPGDAPIAQGLTAASDLEQLARAPRAPRALNKNSYYSSSYVGGSGERDRIEKLVEDGVIVDGKTVKLAAFTREYSQAFEIPTKQAINVHVDLEQAKVLQKGGEVHLQVGLQAIKREAPKRPAINLCLVIDTSGSMMDESKLDFARKAALDVVDGLSATDTLGVVVYEDVARVLIPAAKLTNKREAKALINSLAPGGATNIYDGLKKAYAQVKREAGRDTVNEVILLSDGMVTAGFEEPYAFRELVGDMADEDIQTTAVGMGMEFDETIMMEVAQSGRGGYHFIKRAEETQAIFREELGQLTRVVAKALKLRIELPEGIELLRVLGSAQLTDDEAQVTKEMEQKIDHRIYEELGIQKNREKDDEPGIKMLIPHFFAGDSHVVMLKLLVPRGKKAREVARIHVKYKDLVFRKNREVNEAARIQYTTDKAKAIASISRPVKKNVLGFKTGEALLTAAEYIKRGQTSAAAQVIDEHMVVLGVAAREWRDKDLNRDGELLSRYEHVIAAAGGGSLAGSDLGTYLAKSMTYSGYELTR